MNRSPENDPRVLVFAGCLLVLGGVLAALTSLEVLGYVDTTPNRVPIFPDPYSWEIFALGSAMTSLGVSFLLPRRFSTLGRINNWALGVSAAAVAVGVLLRKLG